MKILNIHQAALFNIHKNISKVFVIKYITFLFFFKIYISSDVIKKNFHTGTTGKGTQILAPKILNITKTHRKKKRNTFPLTLNRSKNGPSKSIPSPFKSEGNKRKGRAEKDRKAESHTNR